jgi:hypothetical protein
MDTPDEFVSRCLSKGIPIAEAELHKNLYALLIKLDSMSNPRSCLDCRSDVGSTCLDYSAQAI